VSGQRPVARGNFAPTEERLSDCVLIAYGDAGMPILERRVEFPHLPDRPTLERIRRDAIDGARCRYAVVKADRRVRGLYLAEDLLPQAMVRVGSKRGKLLRWLTSAVPLDSGLRGFCGPEMFLRQVDLGGVDAWLAPLLVGFVQDVPVRRHQLGWESIYEWDYLGDRYLYRAQRQRWILYGAGNSPVERVQPVLKQAANVDDFLWEIGALKVRP
jgi:hypothetical protein